MVTYTYIRKSANRQENLVARPDFGPREIDPGTSTMYEEGFLKMSKPRARGGALAAKITVWTVLSALVLLNVVNLVATQANGQRADTLNTMFHASYNPSFKVRYSQLGAEIIRAWYSTSAVSSPIPVAESVTWPGTEVAPEGTPEGEEPAPVESEGDLVIDDIPSVLPSGEIIPSGAITIGSITFIDGSQVEHPTINGQYAERNDYAVLVNGAWYTISVTIGIESLEDNSIPVLLAPPTLQPRTMSQAAPANLTGAPTGWSNFSATDAVTAQLVAWATAYTTNDSASLKRITGDSADSYYVGLTPSKWDYVTDSLKVLWSYERPASEGGGVVASVEWNIKVPDYSYEDPGDGTTTPEKKTVVGAQQVQRMDVLIEDAKSGLPRIVAWSATGTYPELRALHNALTKEEFEALPGSDTPEGDAK